MTPAHTLISTCSTVSLSAWAARSAMTSTTDSASEGLTATTTKSAVSTAEPTEAIRTEYAQLDPLRTAGQISSTDAARRQAELMEEEAEVLDQITGIENRRAELTGKPVPSEPPARAGDLVPAATPTPADPRDAVAATPAGK